MIHGSITDESGKSSLLTLGDLTFGDFFALSCGPPQKTADVLARLDPGDCDATLCEVRNDALVSLERSRRRLVVNDHFEILDLEHTNRFHISTGGIALVCEVCGGRDHVLSAKRTWAIPIPWPWPTSRGEATTWRQDRLISRMFVAPGKLLVRYVLVCQTCSRTARRGKRGIQRCNYIESYGARCDQLADRGADYCAAHRPRRRL